MTESNLKCKILDKKHEFDENGKLVIITQKEINCKCTYKYIPRPCKICGADKKKLGGWYCAECRLKSKYLKYKDKPKHSCTVCLAPRDRDGYLCISCHAKKLEERKIKSKNLRIKQKEVNNESNIKLQDTETDN